MVPLASFYVLSTQLIKKNPKTKTQKINAIEKLLVKNIKNLEKKK